MFVVVVTHNGYDYIRVARGEGKLATTDTKDRTRKVIPLGLVYLVQRVQRVQQHNSSVYKFIVCESAGSTGAGRRRAV